MSTRSVDVMSTLFSPPFARSVLVAGDLKLGEEGHPTTPVLEEHGSVLVGDLSGLATSSFGLCWPPPLLASACGLAGGLGPKPLTRVCANKHSIPPLTSYNPIHHLLFSVQGSVIHAPQRMGQMDLGSCLFTLS